MPPEIKRTHIFVKSPYADYRLAYNIGEKVAKSQIGDEDLFNSLVKEGFLITLGEHSKRLKEAEEEAKKKTLAKS